MLKHAYNLGYKQALADAGLIQEPEDAETNPSEDANPSNMLAEVFQNMPNPDQHPERDNKTRDPGKSDDDGPWGARSTSFTHDDLSNLGIDIRGPESTAV